jgi:hypothetical protein
MVCQIRQQEAEVEEAEMKRLPIFEFVHNVIEARNNGVLCEFEAAERIVRFIQNNYRRRKK